MRKKKVQISDSLLMDTEVTRTVEPTLATLPAPVKVKTVKLSELDFTELKKLDTDYQQVFQQLNFISGNIARLQREAESLLQLEQERFISLENRRQDIIKRYSIDQTRKWQISPDAEIVYE